MIRAWALGAVWFLLFYLACSFAIAGFVVATHGLANPAVVTAESSALGARFGGLMLLGSLLAAIIGTWNGWLPGTRRTVDPQPPPFAATPDDALTATVVGLPPPSALPFGPLQAFALLVLQLAAQLAGAVVVGLIATIYARIAAPATPLDTNGPQFLALALVGGAAFQVLASVWYVRSRAGLRLTDGSATGVAWRPAPNAALGQGLMLGAVLGLAVVALVMAFPPDESALNGPLIRLQRAGGWPFGVLVLFAIGLAPVLEEFVFRGAAFGAIHARWGLWPAALIPGACFVALHAADKIDYLPGFAFVAALAALTTWLRVRHGSLAPCIAAHFAYNFAAVVAG